MTICTEICRVAVAMEEHNHLLPSHEVMVDSSTIRKYQEPMEKETAADI